MSDQIPLPHGETATNEMAVEPAPATHADEATEARPKAKKAAETLIRDAGKSLLPYARVQKILKADKDLIMVQREAVFLISRATEQFVHRLSEASQTVASKEKRTTVQAKDLVSSIRRAEEFAFLEELLPWLETEQSGRKLQGEQGKGKGKVKDDGTKRGDRDNGPTMLDQFVTKSFRHGSPDEDEHVPHMDIVMNEDGTMSMVEEAPS